MVIDHSKIITLSSDIKKVLVDTTCFSTCRMIFLETNEHSLLRSITRVYSDDNKLFILDKSLNKIILFDMNGNYLTAIHKDGTGPSEYQSVMDFCLDVNKKQILLLCGRPYKIMIFNYSGEFIEEKAISDLYFCIISNSDLIYCNKLEINTTNQDSYELTCFNMDMKPIESFLPMRQITSNRFFRGQSLTSTLNDYYTRRFDNAIYRISEGEVEKKYEIDFKKHAFPEALLRQELNDASVEMAREKKYVYTITEVSESENYLMFNTNIAIFLFNKKTQLLEAYNNIMNSSIGLGSNSYFSIGNNHRMVGSILKPSLLIDIKERADQNPIYANFELLKLAEQVEEDSNPLLLLYEFK